MDPHSFSLLDPTRIQEGKVEEKNRKRLEIGSNFIFTVIFSSLVLVFQLQKAFHKVQ